ncbi:MAG: VanZ family protein [Candidatus Portnoybacteria bacterium]|nr:VanZ family protein [Candidatus Portnoybacteria bacterium]
MKTKIQNWFLVFIWAGLIFFLSHQPELKSGLPERWDFFLAKSAHFLEYAILCFLLIQALQEHKLTKKKILILAVILAMGYALADEYHQSFILGRSASLRDVFIDSSGVLLIAWLTKRKVVK